MRSSGGGGYGDPLQRDPQLVRRDIDHGMVSDDAARNRYGVALDADGKVDAAATARLRAALDESRFTLAIVADDQLDAYAGAKGRHRIVMLTAADARTLGVAVDSLIEMFGRHPAPLRAWVRIAETSVEKPLTRSGQIRLDAFGRQVLGVGDGDRIMLRHVPTPVVRGGLA